MSKLSIRLMPEAMRSLAFGSIAAGSYTGIGTRFSNPIRILLVQNLTDATLTFSFDGINDHFPLAASGFLLLDVTSNKSQVEGFYISEGQRIYTKGSPGSGSVYVTAFYGSSL